MSKLSQLDYIYLGYCDALLTANPVGNTRELNNISFTIHNINENIVSVRDISPSYLFGELIWYFSGRHDTRFISAFSKFWEKLSDNGRTSNSAYGYLMQYAFGFNQIEKVIELLKQDPDSRRAKINLNTPNGRVIETKDEPCTVFLQFMIRGGKLHCTAVMRSNDIWLGLPYDVAFFTEVQKYIARQLGVEYGTYTHFVVSMHAYERDIEKIQQIVSNPVSKPLHINNEELVTNAELLGAYIDQRINRGEEVKEEIVKLFDRFEICTEVLHGEAL